jgi:hypothetical protein
MASAAEAAMSATESDGVTKNFLPAGDRRRPVMSKDARHGMLTDGFPMRHAHENGGLVV